MLGRLILAGSLLVAALALFLSQWDTWSKPVTLPVAGRNNTVLFMTNRELGLSNTHLATVYALLGRHPEVRVHFASFTSMAPRLERISQHGRRKMQSTRDVVFHELPDQLGFTSCMANSGRTFTDIVHPPGIAGSSTVCRDMSFYVSPWTGEDHFTLYQRLTEIIDAVDPALVVLDPFFRPAIDATRGRNRLHAVLTPNPPIDNFFVDQPYGGWLWKYPIMGSGLPYPISWGKIPENIYLSLRYLYTLHFMPHYTATQKFLTSRGLKDRVTWFNLYRSNVPWFTQTLPGASVPLEVIPPNVTSTGPIILSLTTVEEQSPDLACWLARAPTVLINLGGLYLWTESQATAMAQGVADVLSANEDLKVLWKLRKAPIDAAGTTYDDEFKKPLTAFIKEGRVKMESWLAVDPTTLLETGNFAASVHHGGAGCYNEALGIGVPQVALPQWLDHYNLAQVIDEIGVGVWGCRRTSPYWTAECLRDAISTVVSRNGTGAAMREKARYFADIAQSDPGQYVVARGIAKLAASGHGP